MFPLPIDLTAVAAAFTSIHHRFPLLVNSSRPLRADGQSSQTIQDALSALLPHIDIKSWPERSDWGGIFQNSRATTYDAPLEIPGILEYFEPKGCLKEAADYFPDWQKNWVIFEDPDLLIVFKPERLPCLPAREQRSANLRSYLETYTGGKIHLPSRLDTSTQGLVVTSKSDLMNAPLQHIFERRQITKLYLCGTELSPAWRCASIQSRIARHPGHRTLRTTSLTGGARGLTQFSQLHRGATSEGSRTILAALPYTGRTHQIRVHAAAMGIPLVGDRFYGGAQADSLHLLSFGVKFRHPLSLEDMSVIVPERLLPDWVPAAVIPSAAAALFRY